MLYRTRLLGLALFTLPLIAQAEDNTPPDDDTVKDKGPSGEKDPITPAKCITHSSQARFSSGYDHLVHISNSCTVAAQCRVSTDVNPKVQSVTVPPTGKKTVLTFRGSPARAFKAQVECIMKK